MTDVVIQNLGPALHEINRTLEDRGINSHVGLECDGVTARVVVVSDEDHDCRHVLATEPLGRVGVALVLMANTLRLLDGSHTHPPDDPGPWEDETG